MAKSGAMKAGLERQYSKITELEMKYQQRLSKDGVNIFFGKFVLQQTD